MGLNGKDQSPHNFPNENESISTVGEFWCTPCPVPEPTGLGLAQGLLPCGWSRMFDAEKSHFTFLAFPFLIWLSAGDWWVLISESRRRELSEGSFGVYGSRSGTLIYQKTFWFGWPAGVEDCCLEFPPSKQTLGYVRTKPVLAWWF
jgi:hypothetical protein